MPTVAGRVFFSSARTLNTGTGIANVPIVLRNTSTGVGITVLTNSTGNYQIDNVPAGSYTLVEAWGQTGGVASPADFNSAAAISAPTPEDPPVSAVTSPPAGTNRIDSISQNTFNITVSGNVTQNFTDSPVKDNAFVVNDLTLVGSNLITSANNGDWGTLPAGTAINTRPATEPYPGVVPDFTYSSGVPGANAYTVSNITNGLNPSWWNLADHTSGDETGRMEVINGGPVGNSFFRQTVSILPNTYYLFSSWFANMVNQAGFPAGPGVRITNLAGTLLFSTAATNIPSSGTLLAWDQIGSLFNTGNNTAVVVSFVDVNGGASGNDYVADDFSLIQATPDNILIGTTKSVDKTTASVGDTLTYTIVVKNTGVSTAENIVLLDTAPNGTTYQTGSVTINGTTFATKNPSPPNGLTLPNIGGGGVTTVTFKVKVTTTPNPNPIPNSANLNYGYAPVVGGTTIPFAVNTNTVNTFVDATQITKSVSENFGTTGDTIVYTIVIKNAGAVTLSTVVFSDTIPTSTTYVANSFKINGVTQTGANPNPPGVTIPNVGIGETVTLSFSATVNTLPTTNPITNQGQLAYVNASIPQTILTNTVSTTINFVNLTSTKIVNKNFANIGDILTYTIPITNSGNTTATSILFLDTIPSGTTFIAGSLKQDGTALSGTPATPGATLPNPLRSLGVTTVTFQVQVTTFPNPNPIVNTAATTAQYTIDTTTTPIRTGTATTNTNQVTTQVNTATIPNPTKSVDKAFSKVGDTLTYTILLTNTGNTTATTVVFKDTIPNNTSFIVNSVTVGGVTQLGAVVAPPTGLSVGTIPAGSSLTITFQVVVDTIPVPNPIPNSGVVSYTYTVDPVLGTTVANSAGTNTVTTQVNTAIVGTTKSVSATNILVGDTVTYTMVLKNTGNTTANSVLLTDTIPNGGTFVADSVTVNGTTQTGINPQTNGVVVPTLPVGGVATVTFKVILDTIPTPNPTPNTAVTSYSYLLDSSTPTNQSAANSSNTVTTFVNPNANPLKVVNKTSATVGDTLVYFIQWINVTNTTQTNVIFVDTLPNGVAFVPNTLTVNGVNQVGGTITPPNGINTGTLPVGSTVSVTYQVLINTVPVPNPIPNTASVTETGLSGTQTAETNEVLTQVNFAEITQAPKTVDKAFNTVGETMTYTIVLFNNGNTSANNVLILDTIPNGTTFVVNSVSVNGVNQPGAVVAPTTGLTLSCIPAGTAATITFQVLAQSIPTPNPTPNTASASYTYTVDNATGQTKTGNINTNTVTTTIVDATIVSTKVVNKSFAQVGDTLTYTIVLTATGNTTANNAIFIDSLPSTLTYVPGTFAINGGIVAGANPAPPGQSIGSLTIPATYTITFNAVVNTIPSANPIQNQAQTNYAYTVEPTIANSRTRGSATNIANTTVSQASLGGITKATDKLFADCGETVTYTVVIPNSGNVTATNVVFRDTIPSGTILVANSVTVNGTTQTGASPQTGINLGTIAPGSVTTVVFKVTVQC